jgi:hypothetical protein
MLIHRLPAVGVACVFLGTMLSILGLACLSWSAERPTMPALKKPVMFNTVEADRILTALQVFPPDNPWNEDISKRPVLANSRQIIAAIGADKNLAYNLDMAFILVPARPETCPGQGPGLSE